MVIKLTAGIIGEIGGQIVAADACKCMHQQQQLFVAAKKEQQQKGGISMKQQYQ